MTLDEIAKVRELLELVGTGKTGEAEARFIEMEDRACSKHVWICSICFAKKAVRTHVA